MHQIETWFGILTRQAIRRGSFENTRVFAAAIERFTREWSAGATPFTWVKSADEILAKAVRQTQGDSGATRWLHSPMRWLILNRMVQYTNDRLDASFAALSDATRRGVLEQLGRADASITGLAQTFHMTLTGMRKHVGVLEQAELVTTEKVGRVRTCRLGPRRLDEETAWIEQYGQLWDSRFDELDKVVEELSRKEKVDGRNKRE